MTTYAQLTQQLKARLRAYTGVQEQVTYLTGACTSSDTTLSVNDSDAVSIGVSELEDELIYVQSATDGSLTLPPFGRGFGGTTAAAHGVNTMLTFDPVFPTSEVKRAINQTITACYPILFQVKSTTLTFSGSAASYELPADCDRVLKVTYDSQTSSLYWPAVLRFEFDQHSEEHATGKALIFHEAPTQASVVKVVYQASFSELSADADTLASIGFPESAVDVIIFGAAASLIRFIDVGRLQTGSVENISRSQLVQPGEANKLANQLYAMHQQRLQEERRKLLELNPPHMHFTR